MNKPEILKPKEMALSTESEPGNQQNSLTKSEFEQLYNDRQNSLNQIKPVISLKFYHQIEEKLQREKQIFEQLLFLEDAKQQLLSHYSFVLNPYFFEQKFLN